MFIVTNRHAGINLYFEEEGIVDSYGLDNQVAL